MTFFKTFYKYYQQLLQCTVTVKGNKLVLFFADNVRIHRAALHSHFPT